MKLQDDWVRLSRTLLREEPELQAAIERFRAPDTPAGREAERWLQKQVGQLGWIQTYVLMREGAVAAFHSLRMGEARLFTRDQKRVGVSHPSQGAIIVVWLARAADADVDAETILSHAVGIGQGAARSVGASLIALDPYDSTSDEMWRRLGFRRSATPHTGADGAELRRLFRALFPAG